MDDIRVCTSDIPLHRSTYGWHMNDTRIAYERHANDIRNIKPYKGFGAFRL